uniref:Uncharacterized protein n=1 Tax=Caudovirales sp. cthNP28 TaxID=2826780 RepID=A0A8S5M146_9CAUD|nr:MAG TPA: hypothetical protein [Caudovirales sp. cthNP28]
MTHRYPLVPLSVSQGLLNEILTDSLNVTY